MSTPNPFTAGIGRLIPGITKGVRTALPYVQKLALQGTGLSDPAINARLLGGILPTMPRLSANEIIRQVRAAGFGVNRQRALDAIRLLRGNTEFTDSFNSASGRYRPRMADVPLSAHAQRSKYYIKVTVSQVNDETGDTSLRHLTLRSDRLLTPDDITASIAGVMGSGEAYTDVSYEDHVVTSYTIRNPELQ